MQKDQLDILPKRSILDVQLGSKYASGSWFIKDHLPSKFEYQVNFSVPFHSETDGCQCGASIYFFEQMKQ